MFVFIFFCTIGSILGAPTSDAEFNKDEKIFESANKALEIYNKTLDGVIPWNIFHEVITTLEDHQGRYSSESGRLVGTVKTLLMNSEDHYFSATQSIYNWCGESIPLLEAYVELFNNYDKERAEAQKTLLLLVLDSGILKMDDAITMLNQSGMSLNDASGQLETLGNQLNLDFKEGSKVHEQEIEKVRNGQWMAWVNPIAGLIITIVNEVDTIPKLKENMKQVEQFYGNLKVQVDRATDTITEAKIALKQEIVVIGDLRSQTASTRSFVPIGHLIRKKLEESVNNLVTQCSNYRTSHNKA